MHSGDACRHTVSHNVHLMPMHLLFGNLFEGELHAMEGMKQDSQGVQETRSNRRKLEVQGDGGWKDGCVSEWGRLWNDFFKEI